MSTHPYYKALRGAAANIALVWGAVAIYTYLPYYRSFLSSEAGMLIFVLATGYTVLSPFLALRRNHAESKGEETLRAATRFIVSFYKYISKPNASIPTISREEKTTLLFFLIKFFFIPMMIQFAIGNYHAIVSNITYLSSVQFKTLTSTMILLYPLFLALLFFIDTVYFAFGYLTESTLLGNKVKSVEPTLLGWIAALLCYPPFNTVITSAIIPWYPNDGVRFMSADITAIVYFVIIVLYTIYVWASVSLGAKSSNLTNRGIIAHGPYSWIRHPHYASKNIAWWITLIPIMSVPIFLSMAAWTTIYAVRAITEERHLLTDPAYQEYVRKVKYRFIPGLL